MWRFLGIWKELALRTGSLLSKFYARYDLLVVAVGFVGGSSAIALLQLIPAWSIFIGVLFLILYAGMLAVYGKIKEIEDHKDVLEGKLATNVKRKAVKDWLGEAMREGRNLRQPYMGKSRNNHYAVNRWVERTHDLIEAAFDKGEAQYFRGDEIDIGFDPIDGCLARLEQLIVRANALDPDPDFDPQKVRSRFNPE